MRQCFWLVLLTSVAVFASCAASYNNKGLALAKSGELDLAIEQFNRAIAANPDNAGYRNNRGNTLAKLGRQTANGKLYERAVEDFDHAVALEPHEANLYVNRANVLDYLGEMNKAIEDYNKAIEIDPTNAKAFFNRSITYSRLKKHDLAIKDLDKAMELDPDYLHAHLEAGFGEGGE